MAIRINSKDFEKAKIKHYRKLSRNMAASIINLMATTDTSYDQIAERMGLSYSDVCIKMNKLIGGEVFYESLDFISDVLITMGATIEWRILAPSSENSEKESS